MNAYDLHDLIALGHQMLDAIDRIQQILDEEFPNNELLEAA